MASGRAQILPFRSAAQEDTVMPASTSRQTVGVVDTDLPHPHVAPSQSTPAAEQLTIQDLGNGHAFLHPLYVKVEQLGDEWVAVSPDLALVGHGESDLDALDDVREQVGELFESLREMRETLGPHLQNQLAFLERLAGYR
jgi:hypothetical protein